MVKKLSQYIKTIPSIFQIAKDNKWEESWIIDLSKRIPPAKEIQKYLNKELYDYLAVEYQWNQPEGAYVLNIAYSKKMIINNHFDFLKRMIFFAIEYYNFESIIEKIDEQIIGRKYLFTQDLDFVRVGIFNHWFSTGPVDIWKKGEPCVLTKKQILDKFEGHENLLKTNLNFQSMAFAYSYDYENMDFGVRHILKVPSSKKIEDMWNIDLDLMLKYLGELEGFKIR